MIHYDAISGMIYHALHLLADIMIRTPQQLHEMGHSTGVHHSLQDVVSSAKGSSTRYACLGLKYKICLQKSQVQHVLALVWSEVPLAMLVNAQADSNCSIVLSLWLRNSTSLMKRMKPLLQKVQKPGQDSQVNHHVDWRVPLTAQDLSRGLGGLRRESGWKRKNKEAHKKSARFQQITWSCLWPSGHWMPFCISSMESRGDCLFSCRGLRREGLPGIWFRISPQGQVFVRSNIPPLGQHVILLVLPQLDRDLP